MSELINQRIDQLSLGEPQPGDYGIFRDMLNSQTKRYLIPAESADNFEWDSVAAAAGDYDIDDVVTYGGNWYQSTTNNNAVAPGTDATWTLLTRAVNWNRWAAGVFAEADVFVVRLIDGEDHIVQLVDATRPYVSADFDAEYAAGDWVSVTQNKIIANASLVGGANLTMDLNFMKERNFDLLASINEIRTWVMLNDDNLIELIVLFTMTSLSAQTFPATWQVCTDAGVWDPSANTWTPTDTGRYELTLRRSNGVIDHIKISGPFNT